MKYNVNDFLESSKNINDSLSEYNVVTAVMKTKFNKWVNQVRLNNINPDDNLNGAEPWHDYGNYKSIGINPKHVCFAYKTNSTLSQGWCANDWDDMKYNRLVLAFIDFNDRVAYRVCRQGNDYNHSESNTCPGRNAIAEKIDMPDGASELIDFYWKEHDDIIKDFTVAEKKHKENRKAADIKKYKDVISEATESLGKLRKNATKKRVELEKQIESAKRQIERIESGKVIYYM